MVSFPYSNLLVHYRCLLQMRSHVIMCVRVCVRVCVCVSVCVCVGGACK